MTDPHPFQLRVATHDDIALLADMHNRSRAATYRGQVPDDYIDRVMPAASLPLWEEKLAQLRDGAGQVLIATLGGAAIGFVCMETPDAQGSAYIASLHAMPGHKGLGAGTRMLEATARWSRERGARRMHLKVLESNAAAIGFYQSRGWVCTGSVHDTWGDGVAVTALVYALDLDAGA